MLRRVILVRTDVSEELRAFIIRMIRIGVLGTLAVTGKRRDRTKVTLLNDHVSILTTVAVALGWTSEGSSSNPMSRIILSPYHPDRLKGPGGKEAAA
jgi:hypothetical protein